LNENKAEEPYKYSSLEETQYSIFMKNKSVHTG